MSRPLWTLDAFLAATGGRLVGMPPAAVTGISIDTRTIAPGEAFFAIRGESLDRHDYVPMAQARDAASAVVAENRAGEFDAAKGPITVVGDVLAALGALGALDAITAPLAAQSTLTGCSYDWAAWATNWRTRTWEPWNCSNGTPGANASVFGQARNGSGTAGQTLCGGTYGWHYNHPTYDGATSSNATCLYVPSPSSPAQPAIPSASRPAASQRRPQPVPCVS